MKKITIYSLCHYAFWLFLGLFLGSTIRDAINYNSTRNAAPFYVFVLANGIKFLLPCAVFAGIAYVLKRKQKNKISVRNRKKQDWSFLKSTQPMTGARKKLMKRSIVWAERFR